ncbi:type IV pilin protein [Thalassotalea aquiviva]|uniref:type IV pilin protein n=1 Tax=Thalassotalea aquiviva TaxID=3242415 RepID=UPI00352B6B4F
MGNKKTITTQGFTLIEAMFTVAIISIIAMIAVPSYMDSVNKAKRSEANQFLMEAAVEQEKFFIKNGTYTQDVTSASGLNFGSNYSNNQNYTLTVAAGPTGSITTSFELVATNAGGTDASCAKIYLNSQSKKYATNSDGAQSTECW